VGSSAGALTGLLFVVITLVAGRSRQAASWGTNTFTTPAVVHFGAVLGVAALLSAPWPALTPPALLLGLAALAGLGYSAVVLRRMRRRIGYEPVGEDWLWFVAAPMLAYLVLVAAVLLPAYPAAALFGIGAVLLLLLLVEIRNAWDLVTYIGIEGLQGQSESDVANQPERQRDSARANDTRDAGAVSME